jgi:hypothetical protein
MGGVMMKSNLKTVLILLMTGTFVSATQVGLARPVSLEDEGSGGTCFAETGMFDLSGLAVDSGTLMPVTYSVSAASAADTLETYEIELEDEGKKGINYKAIVGYTIAAAFVGYILYIMIVPEKEEEIETPPIKDPPLALITITFGG